MVIESIFLAVVDGVELAAGAGVCGVSDMFFSLFNTFSYIQKVYNESFIGQNIKIYVLSRFIKNKRDLN